jgi:3-oxosteroid 1-dehydrogenase
LIAAITAAKSGLHPIILEKSDKWGGTSSISGGSLWIPGHHLMAENGITEDMDAARSYMDDQIAQVGAASSRQRRSAYLETGPKMVRFLADAGFEWEFSPFPDYYPEDAGASYGRGVNAKLFDGAELGPWLKSMRSMVRIPSVVALPHEFKSLLMPTRKFRHMINGLKVGLRTYSWKLRGRSPMFIGGALTGRLMQIVQRLGIQVRLETAVIGLISENGRVVGVRAQSHATQEEIRADAGVILCAGGFAHNQALRKKYQDTGAVHSVAIPEDTGDALQAALQIGAAIELMDDAWWGVSAIFPDGSRSWLFWERTLPGSIVVDQTGRRFANEAAPYNDFGRAIVARDKIYPANPSWLIMDARHRKRYVFANLLGGYTPGSLIKAGFFIKAASLAELAQKCDINATNLEATIRRFNGFSKTGIDEDFGRGNSMFDRIYGDDDVGPNPTLGPIEQAPFWAVRVYPSDLGTKGGLLTDENGQVLDTSGRLIPGLYASGNTTASIMGRGYPGPGSTLGPASVFAYRASLHAATQGHMS